MWRTIFVMMKKLALSLVAGACILSLSAGQALAEDCLTKSTLKKHGIGVDYTHTALSSFSHRGDFVYLIQNTDFEQARKGQFSEVVAC